MISDSHTCPVCAATVHTTGSLVAWITADGRLLLEMASPAPTQQRWLELSGSQQNWVADLLHQAGEKAKERQRP